MARKPKSDRLERDKHSLIRAFQSETAEIDEANIPLRLRMTLVVLVALFLSLLVTAAFFDVDRVVTSSFGQIVTVDPPIVLQPLDTSIIKSIAVKEGERVRAGQVLAELDSTFTAADLNTLQLQLAGLTVQIARAQAELDDKPFVPVVDQTPGADKYITAQTALYAQRKAQYQSQVRSYDEQIAQAAANITRYKTDVSRFGDRGKFTSELESMREQLVAKGLDSRVNLLQASDAKTEMLRNIDEAQSNLVAAQHLMEATKAGREAFVQQWYAEASQELLTARGSYDSIKEQVQKAQKHQDLVRLTAPEDAIVLRIGKLSVGSVLQAGETFIELASLRAPVEAEIIVDTKDIGFIRPGDPTVIKLDPYNFVEHGTVLGKLRWISAGTFVSFEQSTGGSTNPAGTSTQGNSGTQGYDSQGSPGGGRPFYKARVEIIDSALKNVPSDFSLMPGMTLSADIKVGTRSLLRYLARGVVRGFNESMREP